MEIIPTNTCPPDFSELTKRSEAFSKYAEQIHLDVDDAKFAPVLSWPYFPGQWDELNRPLPFADLVRYEAHLMVNDPFEIGKQLAHAGCFRILGHFEAFDSDDSIVHAFSAWKAAGASEVGLSVLIDTSLEKLYGVVSACNSILLMSIATLGAQGASFDNRIFERIATLHAMYPDLLIAVDGGVNESNIEALARAGATRFCVGSGISKSPDPAEMYKRLISLAESAL